MTTIFKQVGPFEIVRQIGHGGMAVVFLAVDTRRNRQVALKLVQLGNDREAREIVDAEKFGAELQKQFSERGVHVPVVYEHGVDADSGYFYVAMEYLDGENLSELIARGPLAIERAVEIGIELARFLEDAHGFEAVIDGRNLQSLLHLDLKPRNVRITSAHQVKVFDFGTAKALSLSRKVTRNDFGSVAYLSPERLETGEVDARADLWALGVVLYEMLRGSPPFQAADTRRLERLILSRRPAPSLMERCPIGLQAVVARMLDPTPEERYADAREIREDLERFTSGQRTVAEEQGWPARSHDDAVTRRTRAVETADAEKTRRTRLSRPDPVVPPPIPVTIPPPPRQEAARIRRSPTRVNRLVRVALMVLALGLAINEISVAVAAGRVTDGLATREFDQLPAAWDEYDRLDNRSHLNFGTAGLERALIGRTMTLVDRVMANYRTPSPTVREAQWAAARDALFRALRVASRSDDLRAALRYCEGQLHRINGEANKAREATEEASRDFTEALVAFREAAEIRPGWPDPFLGLARVFLVGLDDVDLGANALSQAQEHGYQPSDRDFAQLADGFRGRASSLIRSARQVEGLPQERDYLTRAADDYRQALLYYAQAGNFANAPQNVARTQRALVLVEDSLAELAPAAPASEETAPAASEEATPATPLQGSSVSESAPWQ